MVTLGIFTSYIVGTLVSWHWLALVTSFVPIVLAVLLVFVPESPRYLLSRGRTKEAAEALRWLRGGTSVKQVQEEVTGV
jgi:MFS family permease